MTREDATEIWLPIIKTGIISIPECYEAIDMAIKALEQEPCTDAISREAVKNIIRGGVCTDTEADIEYVCGLIDGLPFVTPQSKAGRWVGIDEEPHEDYECNRCGYVVSTFTANIEPHTEYKYCPNCGTKMQEVHNENAD